MSHPVGPAVLPCGRPGRTADCRPGQRGTLSAIRYSVFLVVGRGVPVCPGRESIIFTHLADRCIRYLGVIRKFWPTLLVKCALRVHVTNLSTRRTAGKTGVGSRGVLVASDACVVLEVSLGIEAMHCKYSAANPSPCTILGTRENVYGGTCTTRYPYPFQKHPIGTIGPFRHASW